MQPVSLAAFAAGQAVLHSLLLDGVTVFGRKPFEAGGPYFSQDGL